MASLLLTARRGLSLLSPHLGLPGRSIGLRFSSTTGTAGGDWGERLREAVLKVSPEPIPESESGAQLLRLPEGVEWPQIGAAPLFVRHFYGPCYESVMAGLPPGKHFYVRGTEGIGKSAFAAYLLYQAVRAGRPTVYISDKVDSGFIFREKAPTEQFQRKSFAAVASDILRDPETVLLFDGDGDSDTLRHAPVFEATTVLFTSPQPDRYFYLRQLGALELNFPVFSYKEMQDMLRSCFPKLLRTDRAGVWERYRKFGGIPADVFTRPRPGHQTSLERALKSISLEGVADVLMDDAVDFDRYAMHRLFHLRPMGVQSNGSFVDGDKAKAYRLDCVEMGSPFIRRAVYEAITERRCDRLLHLLDGAK